MSCDLLLVPQLGVGGNCPTGGFAAGPPEDRPDASPFRGIHVLCPVAGGSDGLVTSLYRRPSVQANGWQPANARAADAFAGCHRN